MSSHPRRRLEYPYSDCTGSKDQGMTVREVFDLHGYTKTAAIQAMTVFFDAIRSRNQPLSPNGRKYMVEIITGTGQHSSHGPVLRSAVAAALIKRQMDHKLSSSRGSFIVDALSGVDLYEDTSTRYDSKVVVVDKVDSYHPASSTDSSYTPSYRPRVPLHHFAQSIHSHPYQNLDEEPLLQTIQEMSCRLAHAEHVTLQSKEEQEFKRAMLKSLEWKRIQELDTNDDQIETERALALSRIENEALEHEYNQMMAKVVKSSMRSDEEHLSLIQKEQAELEWAIKSSRNDYEALQTEEDEQLRLALQLSSNIT